MGTESHGDFVEFVDRSGPLPPGTPASPRPPDRPRQAGGPAPVNGSIGQLGPLRPESLELLKRAVGAMPEEDRHKILALFRYAEQAGSGLRFPTEGG